MSTTTSGLPRAATPESLGPRVGPGGDTADLHTPARKRKSSGPPASSNKNDKSPNVATRQKITRACDSCKVKKTRCTGTLPCTRCTRLSLPCRYNAAYSRGLPPQPLPGAQLKCVPGQHQDNSINPTATDGCSRHTTGIRPGDDAVNSHIGTSAQRLAGSLRNSPEPGSTDFEGNYLGPASGISFINRVWSRLHQDEKASVPDELQNASSKNTAVFSFGDNPYNSYGGAEFSLPTFDKAMELVAVYFDFSMVTYRFVHRGRVESWVKYLYENNISMANLPTGNMVIRTAIVLVIFAISTLHEELHPGRSAGDSKIRFVA